MVFLSVSFFFYILVFLFIIFFSVMVRFEPVRLGSAAITTNKPFPLWFAMPRFYRTFLSKFITEAQFYKFVQLLGATSKFVLVF